jgi:uncharacterized repeat protein (TIGR01451 family)
MNPMLRLGILSAALALALPALAEEAVVTSSMTANRVELVDGKTVLHPATEARPGDVLEYRATYVNHGGGAVDHLQATVPVPAGTTYLGDSALPNGAQASTDARSFAPLPLQHRVKGADGQWHQEAVPLADYRALRWDVGSLNPGKSAVVSLHVRINPTVVSQAERP